MATGTTQGQGEFALSLQSRYLLKSFASGTCVEWQILVEAREFHRSSYLLIVVCSVLQFVRVQYQHSARYVYHSLRCMDESNGVEGTIAFPRDQRREQHVQTELSPLYQYSINQLQ